ncbi:MAG: bifunctional diaminohydroxyphosphoribosylaminopyrimidine deaminase/5-amino-6-(5-phosphoribosylamino)uracil reductase RibD [Clostridium perfringens]|nr:bifunctional diaminohydroxyphosphoribosylaminopyrimidine deaminase/5-amino-6-(5-phosphoribosylamino)uracil reductase RibD [Clostridium perfringens]
MDEFYMNLALENAKKGRGKVNPNPMVGAVIVKNEKIIGIGYHEFFGGTHAEVNAFKNATEDVVGGTIYVTLEPCSHYGKTPPCADKIIEKKIRRVVVGSLDPNPIVAGRGIKKLRDAGIEVTIGVLGKECIKLNEVFMKYIKTKKPFVVLKCAMSLDGKICTRDGESKWITGEKAREHVHKTRGVLSGIMVGVETVIEDNPRLTSRVDIGKNPIRIVVDSTLRIPLSSNVLTDKFRDKTIIATTDYADKKKIREIENLGVKVLVVESKEKRVNLNDLMYRLGEMNIDSIFLEGGGTLNFSALREGIIDKVQIYIAPKIIGGTLAKTPVEGEGIDKLKDAFNINDLKVNFFGNDIFIEGYLN